MYSRLKPFRCQHPSNGRRVAFESCDYQLTRGYPDQFLHRPTTAAGRDQHAQTISRDQLITALTQAHQREVQSLLTSGVFRISERGWATPWCAPPHKIFEIFA